MIFLSLARKNVTRKRERSLLTIVGVLLAVGSFVALLSIAEGLYYRVHREVHGRSVDIYIQPRNALPLPTGPVGTLGISTENLPVTLAESIQEKIPNIRNVASICRLQENFEGEVVIVWGIEYDKFYNFLPYFRIREGSMFSDQLEAVVGSRLAQKKGIKRLDEIQIRKEPFKVVGIGSAGGGFQDYFCYILLPEAQKIQGDAGVQEIWVQVHDRKQAEDTAREIERGFPGYSVKTAAEYLGGANEIIKYAWLLQFAVAAIGVLIAMTAAMNTMLMSTFERLREFGTLRAVGASRATVVLMIMAESLILSMAGGSCGIILGIMGSRLLDDAVSTFFRLSFPMANITVGLILEALILSFLIGLVGALIPATLIYRMNIIAALRWE